jgi:ribosomal protein L37AE/L43A
VLYRVVHAINTGYGFAVFWAYVGAFVVACAFIFVLPPVALGLVLFGVMTLVIWLGIGKLLATADRALVRRLLREGRCPRCDQADQPALQAGDDLWTCRSCSATYEPGGGLPEGDERPVISNQA